MEKYKRGVPTYLSRRVNNTRQFIMTILHCICVIIQWLYYYNHYGVITGIYNSYFSLNNYYCSFMLSTINCFLIIHQFINIYYTARNKRHSFRFNL